MTRKPILPDIDFLLSERNENKQREDFAAGCPDFYDFDEDEDLYPLRCTQPFIDQLICGRSSKIDCHMCGRTHYNAGPESTLSSSSLRRLRKAAASEPGMYIEHQAPIAWSEVRWHWYPLHNSNCQRVISPFDCPCGFMCLYQIRVWTNDRLERICRCKYEIRPTDVKNAFTITVFVRVNDSYIFARQFSCSVQVEEHTEKRIPYHTYSIKIKTGENRYKIVQAGESPLFVLGHLAQHFVRPAAKNFAIKVHKRIYGIGILRRHIDVNYTEKSCVVAEFVEHLGLC